MKALVTGIAGFIGSTLAEHLLEQGWEVVGVDCLTDYYDEDAKQRNLTVVADHPDATVHDVDLVDADLAGMLDGVDAVFHQAGQPGVRASWELFDSYVHHNIIATQALLDAALAAGTPRVVYASSSSVYGDATTFPTTEEILPAPKSPYGVTKLAAEHLCGVYARSFGLNTVSLRYFTVFGPRQRPDMAMHRLVEAALDGTSFPLYGDGSQVRDFTYVDDIVRANVLAATTADIPAGTVINLSGGGSVTLSWVIDTIGELVGRPIELDRQGFQAGDVDRTGGSTERAAEVLGWSPQVSVHDGLAHQVEWHRARRA